MATKDINSSQANKNRSLRCFPCGSVRLPSVQKQNTSPPRTTSGTTDLNTSVESGYSSDNTPAKHRQHHQHCTQSQRGHFIPKLIPKFKKSNPDKLLRKVLKRNQNKVNKQLIDEKKHNTKQTGPTTELVRYTCAASDLEDVKYVSSSCVSRLITMKKKHYVLIDGRCPLEFQDSHIQGSINLHNTDMLYNFYSMYAQTPSSQRPAAIIFSSNDIGNGSLKMVCFFRALDLLANRNVRSRLLFPKLYIHNDTYDNFKVNHSRCCEAYL